MKIEKIEIHKISVKGQFVDKVKYLRIGPMEWWELMNTSYEQLTKDQYRDLETEFLEKRKS